MPIKINGSTSGSVTLAAPATGSDVTLTLPGTSGTAALTESPALTGKTTMQGTDASQTFQELTLFRNDASAPTMAFQKSRGATVGANTIVQSGDICGAIVFLGANGTSYTQTAQINAQVDGTPGASNDMPGRLIFSTTPDGSGTPSERARIDSSGNLIVGTSSLPTNGGLLHVNGRISGTGLASRAGSGGAIGTNAINLQWNSSAVRLWVDATDLGSITVSSDYRIKHSVTEATDAWGRVQALRPVTFRWKDEGIFSDDGITHEGFIAHELAEQIPSAVNYGKDAVNENGDPQYQSLNIGEIIPVLTKALQEAMSRIESLEQRVADLENR